MAKKGEHGREWAIGAGLVLGVVFGLVTDNLAMGIALGLVMGIGFSVIAKPKKKDEDA